MHLSSSNSRHQPSVALGSSLHSNNSSQEVSMPLVANNRLKHRLLAKRWVWGKLQVVPSLAVSVALLTGKNIRTLLTCQCSANWQRACLNSSSLLVQPHRNHTHRLASECWQLQLGMVRSMCSRCSIKTMECSPCQPRSSFNSRTRLSAPFWVSAGNLMPLHCC